MKQTLIGLAWGIGSQAAFLLICWAESIWWQAHNLLWLATHSH